MKVENLLARQLLELLIFVECSLEGYCLDMKSGKDSYSYHLKLMCDENEKAGIAFKNFVKKNSKEYKFQFPNILGEFVELYSKTSASVHTKDAESVVINLKSFSISEIFAILLMSIYLGKALIVMDNDYRLTREQLEEFLKTKGKYSPINLI